MDLLQGYFQSQIIIGKPIRKLVNHISLIFDGQYTLQKAKASASFTYWFAADSHLYIYRGL